MLPDVALLDFYGHGAWINAWQTLVHVCRNWRTLVFESPRRLNLQLLYKPSVGRPVRELLDVWPVLPIAIRAHNISIFGSSEMDHILAALKHNDRISHLYLNSILTSHLNEIVKELQQPLRALTYLSLQCVDDPRGALRVPASFLGGSAPRLQELRLYFVSFPTLPKLLLSAPHLVNLTLESIPRTGYISPEAMVACLSVLTRLETLNIEFKSPKSRPDPKSRRPPPQTLALLPVLTRLSFEGVSEYLEDFVARIDAPLLTHLDIYFFHRRTFATPRLAQFISRTPTFKAHHRARMAFPDRRDVSVFPTLPQTSGGTLDVNILIT